MNRLALGCVCFATVLGLALPAAWAGPEKGRSEGPRQPSPELVQRIQTQRAVELAVRLGLDDQAAIKLARKMQDFDAKRREMRGAQHEVWQKLKQQADNPQATAAEVSATVKQVKDNRGAMLKLAHDEYEALAQGLTPSQQAKLAIFMHEFPKQMRRLAREHMQGERQRLHGEVGSGAGMGGRHGGAVDDDDDGGRW